MFYWLVFTGGPQIQTEISEGQRQHVAYLSSEAVGKPAVQSQFQHDKGEERDLPGEMNGVWTNLRNMLE
jgi:hypothetical protein